MRLIIDTALDAVIAINSQGEITEWNPQAEIIFGWSHARSHRKNTGRSHYSSPVS